MSGILRHELQKALCSPWFALALGVALVLSMGAALESYLLLKREEAAMVSFGYELGLHAHNYLGQTRESSFGNWIVVSANAPLFASLFFFALPLLAVIPFAWSFRSEAKSGYAVQVSLRSGHVSYVRAKLTATFVTGALIALIPLLVNFLAVSCLFPAYQPRIEESNYVGLFDVNLFSLAFYTYPLVYVVIYTLLDTLLMGAWASAVMGLASVVRDRVKLAVVPYLFLLALHYFNGWLFDTLQVQGFNFDLISSLRAETLVARPELMATLLSLVLMVLVAWCGARVLEREEVLS